MDRWKAEMEESEKRREEERRSQRESLRRKKIQVLEKVGKSRNTVFFQWFGAKATGAEPAGQMRDEKFVTRSTFASEKAKITSCSEHFLKLRCRETAGRCGANHISKSKCTKHTRFGALFEVEMSKKCTPLWRKAHFDVKMCKTHKVRTTFGSWDVEKVHAVVARSSQNAQNTTCSRHFWTLKRRFAWQAQGIVHLVKRAQDVKVLWHFQKRWQAWDIWRGSAKMLFPWQAQYSSELLQGPGADFLRGVAFWSLRSSGLLRWFCVTSATLRVTRHHFFVAGAVV